MPLREPRPSEVAETLTRLREDTGLSTPAAAKAAGLAQATLSRYELGRIVPPADAIKRLCDLYEAPEETRRRLANLTREARPRHRRVVLHRPDAPKYQREYRDLEERAARIRSFTTTGVPGLLQTDAYTRAVIGDELTGAARARWIFEREKRRAVLDAPTRALEFVTTTGALLWNLGGADIMARQIERLVEVSELAHVAFGIITPATPTDLYVTNNINLFELADGRRRVLIGTTAATAILDDAREVEQHAALLDRLAALASFGDDARAELARVGQWYAS